MYGNRVPFGTQGSNRRYGAGVTIYSDLVFDTIVFLLKYQEVLMRHEDE